MVRDVLHKDDLERYRVRKKFVPKQRTPRNNERYEIPEPLGKSRKEIALDRSIRMHEYVEKELHTILHDPDIFTLASLCRAVRDLLKEDDVREQLHKERMQKRYATAKEENAARAEKAYKNLRRIGRKEIEAVKAKSRILDEFRKEAGK